MKIRTLTTFMLLLAALNIMAQDSLSKQTNITGTPAPLITIKGEEIARYPSADFLDAMNGLFPWVFAQNTDPNNYLFVVNGNVLLDVNSISLYDIEEISFDRNNMNGGLYPFSKAGVFYIKTKQNKDHRPVINFDSQFGILFNKNKRIYPPGTGPVVKETGSVNNKTGELHSNHLSLSLGNDKLHFYASGELQEINTPRLSQRVIYSTPFIDTVEGTAINKILNVKTFSELTYKFSERLNAGISGAYFHGGTKEDSTQNSFYPGVRSTVIAAGKNNLDDYHVNSFVNWMPVRNIENTISFEYSAQRNGYGRLVFTTYDNPVIEQARLIAANSRSDQYFLKDRLSYRLLSKGKFKLTPAVEIAYLKQVTKHNRLETFTTSTGSNWASYFSTVIEEKVTTLNSSIHFAYSTIITGYTGYATVISKIAKELTGDSKANIYGGISVNIKNLIKAGSKLNRLDVSFDYGDVTTDNSANYWISHYYKMGEFVPKSHLAGSYNAQTRKWKLFKSNLISLHINSSFLHDRIQAGAAWSKLSKDDMFFLYSPIFPPFAIYVDGGIKSQGLSLYSAFNIIDKPRRKWNARLNVLFPTTKYDLIQDFYFIETKYRAQAGLQQHFRLNRLSAALNTLVSTGRQQIDHRSNTTTRKETEISLNYLSIAYDISLPEKSFFNGLSVFVQGRNLLADKKTRGFYSIDSYAGAGINLAFK